MFKSFDCLIYSLALEARTLHPYFRFVLNTKSEAYTQFLPVKTFKIENMMCSEIENMMCSEFVNKNDFLFFK